MKKNNLLLILLAVALVASGIEILYLKKGLKDAPTSVDESAIVLKNIHNRKSVRKYTDQSVPDSLIHTILKAGMAAPSGHDARPWQFIVIRDKAVMKKLRSKLEWARGLDYSTVAIVVCGDMRKVNPKNKEFWITDCSAATENILLATEALGLGAVWSTLYPGEDRMQHTRDVLQLPDYLMPLCILPMGYPLEETKPKDKFDPKRIHWESYQKNEQGEVKVQDQE